LKRGGPFDDLYLLPGWGDLLERVLPLVKSEDHVDRRRDLG
jgi:hypothetical protein